MTTRCVVYARQSLDRTGEGAAVDRQVADCRKLAEARGWDVAEVISDNDMSASTGRRRPGYERLLDKMLTGQVDVVVVWHIDRLTRRLVDLEQVITICETTGVRLATVTGDLDLSTDTGQLVGRILASVAAAEGKRKAARQRAANRQRAENGHMGWTRRPFAYDRRDGVIVKVEEEAAGLRAAADIVLDGGTLAAGVRLLNDKGLLTTGRRVLRDDEGEPIRDDDGRPLHGPFLPWNVTSLRRALLSPRYAGRVTYHGADMADGTWPTILDAETQQRLAERLRDAGRRKQQGTERKFLCSGLARCGRCGAVMFATTAAPKGHRYHVYRCRACYLTRRLDLVDEVVEGVLLERLSRPDAASLLTPDVDLDALRAEAVELRDRRDGLAELLADGLLSRAAVAEQAEKLTRRIAEVEGRITAALGDNPATTLIGAEDVAEVWDELDVRSQKSVLDLLMQVTILPAGKGQRFRPEDVRITWRTS
jgi:DNA invertase Pin-like site-specific DNA recombinase